MSVCVVERRFMRRNDHLPRVLEAVEEPRTKLAWRGLRHAREPQIPEPYWNLVTKDSEGKHQKLVLGMTWEGGIEDFMSCPKL